MKKLACALAALSLSCHPFAHAEQITIRFTAEISEFSDPWDRSGTLLLYPGEVLYGTYTYESTTPNSNTWEHGVYVHNSPPHGISITTTAGDNFATNPQNTDFVIFLVNDHPDNPALPPVDSYIL